MYDYYLAVDLGQVNDFTAVAVLEEPVWVGPEPPWPLARSAPPWPPEARRGWVGLSELGPPQVRHFRARMYAEGEYPSRPPLYLRHLERTRHAPYPAIVARVGALLARPPLAGAQTALLVDHGGVGRAVLDLMRHAGLPAVGITITAGDEVRGDAYAELRAPKRELVARAQIALAEGRLRISADLELAPTLVKELGDYRVRLSAAGHDSYAAREGQHDDLVMATALAVWYRDWTLEHFDNAASVAADRQSERSNE